jgi:molecular chaperone GrpE (heat shock protein)
MPTAAPQAAATAPAQVAPAQGGDDMLILIVTWVVLALLTLVIVFLWHLLDKTQGKTRRMESELGRIVLKCKTTEDTLAAQRGKTEVTPAAIRAMVLELFEKPNPEEGQRIQRSLAGTHQELANKIYKWIMESQSIVGLQQQLKALEQRLGDQPQPVAQAAPVLDQAQLDAALLRQSAAIELRILVKTLNSLHQDGSEIRQFIVPTADAGQNERQLVIQELLQLESQLANQPRLGAFTTKTVEPVRRHTTAAAKIAGFVALCQTSPDAVSEETLDHMREANIYLGILRASDQAREPLRFDAQAWLAEQFPRFADAFYREYQLAKRQGTAAPLESAQAMVQRLLQRIGLKVVDISLGRTAFDNRFHVARSTASDPSIPDGCITTVIRNGFERLEGGLAQQAEVIVNRI